MSGQPLGSTVETVLLLVGCSHLSSNFFSEVVNWLLDAFAYFEVSEGNDFSTGLLGQLTDLDFRVLDERLLNQAGFCQELADTAFDHIFNNVFWLAFDFFFVQLQEHSFLGAGLQCAVAAGGSVCVRIGEPKG